MMCSLNSSCAVALLTSVNKSSQTSQIVRAIKSVLIITPLRMNILSHMSRFSGNKDQPISLKALSVFRC